MISFFIAYGIATLILFVLDFIWLGVVAKDFYSNQLGNLMVDQVKFGIASAFYLTYTVGIVILAVKPALDANNILIAVGYAALFGFLAYGTYNFTNMSTLKDWPMMMSLVDIVWGTTLTTITATVTYLIMNKYFS